MENKVRYEALKGLPVYGDYPEQFSSTGQGTYREGYVVRFFKQNGESWVGNFQRGFTYFDTVCAHKNNKTIIVIAGGEAYQIDPEAKALVKTFGGAICSMLVHAESNTLIFETGTELILVKNENVLYTKRISFDELRNIKIIGNEVIGEASAPWAPDSWLKFSVNILDGKVTGGAFDDVELVGRPD